MGVGGLGVGYAWGAGCFFLGGGGGRRGECFLLPPPPLEAKTVLHLQVMDSVQS